MNKAVCLATGNTYDLVIQTNVTAHPACAPYPKFIPYYMIPIKKGGIVENLYSIKTIIECFPEDIYSYRDKLPEDLFSGLVSYHEARQAGYGYSKTNEKYRFYLCEKANDIDPSFRVKGVQVSKRINIDLIPLINQTAKRSSQ